MPGNEPTVVRYPAEILDIVAIADYLAETTSLNAAERFLVSADKTIEQIARMPGLGSRWDSDKPWLAEARFRAVTKFRNYLVFYRPTEGGIEVLRVLHAARDIRGILEGEDEEQS
jgi:toxin ParE1/3/4